MISVSDVKQAYGAIKKMPAKTAKQLLIASLLLNIFLGWLLYNYATENRELRKQIQFMFKDVIKHRDEQEEELKRLRKKVEKP